MSRYPQSLPEVIAMRIPLLIHSLSTLFVIAGLFAFSSPSEAQTTAASQPNILYGAAYYNEYMPDEGDAAPALRAARLEKDVALMKEAGISVVRMGESTWSLWSQKTANSNTPGWTTSSTPWEKAGIKVIMGNPHLFHPHMDGPHPPRNPRSLPGRNRRNHLRHAPEHGHRTTPPIACTPSG